MSNHEAPTDSLDLFLRDAGRSPLLTAAQEVKLSKRKGDVILLREDVIDEVGPDATRFTYLMQSVDTKLVFDLDVVVQRSMDNPVFYVQMAHARLSSIFRVAARAPETASPSGVDLAALDEPEELTLMKELADFPSLVTGAAAALEPHRVTGYLEGLARVVHAWYHKYRVLGAPEEAARLVLARAVRQVLANGLTLMGVGAPDRM